MKSVKTLVRVLSAAAALAAFGAPAPAMAAFCPANTICVFTAWDYGGTQWNLTGDAPQFPASMNDQVSSVINNVFLNQQPAYICLYEHWNYSGLNYRVDPQGKVARMAGWFNDKASSARRIFGDQCY
jgi:hypothetical protein